MLKVEILLVLVRKIKEGQKIQRPKEKVQKGQTIFYKTLHRKLMIEQHKSH